MMYKGKAYAHSYIKGNLHRSGWCNHASIFLASNFTPLFGRAMAYLIMSFFSSLFFLSFLFFSCYLVPLVILGSTLIYRLGQRKNRVFLFLKIEFLGQPCNGSVDLISLREKYVSANELFCPTEGGFFLCNRCPLKCEVRRYVWWPKYFIYKYCCWWGGGGSEGWQNATAISPYTKKCPLADYYINSEITTKHSCQ